MDNKYLEKIAEMSRGEHAGMAAGAAVTAAGLAHQSAGPLMGYHTVYHGTSKKNADSIRKTGLDPKRGGQEGGSAHKIGSEAYKKQSAGKVHVTKAPHIAEYFANFQAKPLNAKPLNPHKGEVLKARVSHDQYQRMKVDQDVSPIKAIAATTKEKIHPHQIKGGAGYTGAKEFAHPSKLKGYLKSTSGKKRALMGAGMAVGSVLMGGVSALRSRL